MAQTDLTSLLTGISSAPINPMQGLDREGRMAQRAQGFSDRMTRGMLQAGGQDPRTLAQQAQAALAQLDINNPDDQPKIMEIVSRVNPERAAVLKAQFAQQGRVSDKQGSFATYVRGKYGEALGKLADDKVITPENFNDFLNTGKIKGSSKGESFKVKDEEGNTFGAITTIDLDTQEAKVSYTNLSPDSDVKEPVGAVTPIGGAYSLTASESVDLAGKKVGVTTGSKKFAERKAEAGNAYVAAGFALEDANKMLNALKQINTGGSFAELAKSVTDVLGTTPTSVSEFERLAKAKVLAGLKRFGANPTEGERNFAMQLGENIGKTKGANAAQIQAYIDEMTRVQARERYLLSADVDEAGFNEYTLNQWGDTNKPSADGTEVVDFNELDK